MVRMKTLFQVENIMLDSLISWIGSRGNRRGKSLSIPVFDGAFKPNNLLEEADTVVENLGFSDMVVGSGNRLLAACNNTVVEVSDAGKLTEVAVFDRDVSALAELRDGRLAVGLGNSVVIGAGTAEALTFDGVEGRKLTAVTALYPGQNGGLLVRHFTTGLFKQIARLVVKIFSFTLVTSMLLYNGVNTVPFPDSISTIGRAFTKFSPGSPNTVNGCKY